MNEPLPALPAAAPVPVPSRRPGPAGFTLIELLMVISIIAVLAGMLVGLAPVAGVRMKESRARAELERLVTAIEAYKVKFGVYPPDTITGYQPQNGLPIVDPVINPLFYELSGLVVVNQGNSGYFVSLGDDDAANKRLYPNQLTNFFGPTRDGFVNAATANEARRLFRFPFKDSQHVEISRNPDIEVAVCPVPWPVGDARFPAPIPARPDANPWRYNSSNPIHNPGHFDLWCEIVVRGQKRIIGNWKN